MQHRACLLGGFALGSGVLVLGLVLLATGLAGCLGGSEPQGSSGGAPTSAGPGVPSTGSGAGGNRPEDPAEKSGTNYVPPPAGDCGYTPTNITESRVRINSSVNTSGSAHAHDWWGCDTEVVIQDRNIEMPAGNVCVGSPITFACQNGPPDAQFPKLISDPDETKRPAIVFPGAGKLVIKLDVGQVFNPFYLQISSPGYPDGYQWGKNDFLISQPTTIITLDNLKENHTDAPHTRSSAWTFRLWKGPNAPSLFTGPMHWRVTVHRDTTRTVPVDPPHPDFWEGRTSINLHSATTNVDCKRNGVGVYVTSGSCGSVPDWAKNKTVMVLSKKLVFEITFENTVPFPTKIGLEYCAPGGIPCATTDAVYKPAPMVQENGNTRRFEIDVRPDQWDSPYRPTTAWEFHWYFDGADGTNTGVLTGKLHWKVELLKM